MLEFVAHSKSIAESDIHYCISQLHLCHFTDRVRTDPRTAILSDCDSPYCIMLEQEQT